MTLDIYIEGGGDSSANQRELRRGFSEFFAKVAPPGRRPRIHAGGSRNNTFEDFKTALGTATDRHPILLVDAEDPVRGGVTPWQHLRMRDGWERPDGTGEEQAQLMVQTMEAWFPTDHEALRAFYGQGFQANALPQNPQVEQVPRTDVLRGLENASRNTKKGAYHKTRHGFALLSEVDPTRVRERSPHAARLFDLLAQQ